MTLFFLQSLSYRGKSCGSQTSLGDLGIESGSTVDIALRLRGGGGDGGATGAESRISYLEMYASKKPDKVRVHITLPISSSVRLARETSPSALRTAIQIIQLKAEVACTGEPRGGQAGAVDHLQIVRGQVVTPSVHR